MHNQLLMKNAVTFFVITLIILMPLNVIDGKINLTQMHQTHVNAASSTNNDDDPEIQKPNLDDITADDTTVTGGSTPSAHIEVKDEAENLIGSTTTQEDGSFTVNLERDLEVGESLYVYTVIESQDGERFESDPAIMGVLQGDEESEDVEQLNPPIVHDVIAGDERISGTGEPQAYIDITDVSGEKLIGVGSADEAGNFDIGIDAPAIAGDEIALAQYYVDNNENPVPDTKSELAIIKVQKSEASGANANSNSDGGQTLPQTSTDYFNWLLIGSTIIILGVVSLVMMQVRRKFQSK